MQPIALILHLATKKEPSAMRPCTHKHDKFCSDCDQPFLLFEELKDLVEIGSDSELAKNQKQTAQTVKEFLQVIDDYQSKTNFYIRHLIRTNH